MHWAALTQLVCHFAPLLPALICSEGALDRCQIMVDGSTNTPRALPGVSPASSGQLPDGIARLYFSLGSPSTCYTYSSVVGDFINMTNPTHWSEWQGRAKCFNSCVVLTRDSTASAA